MKRAYAIGTAMVASVIAIAVACSFPAPELVDIPDATTDRTATPTPDGSSNPVDATTADVVVEFDGGLPIPDASKLDGDANVTAPDGMVVSCDVDNDGFSKVGGICGGNDCDDTTRNVRPDQDYNTFEPITGTGPGKGGDWNCNGEVEVRGNRGRDENCGGLAPGCAGEGFVAQNPPCGTSSRYVKCVAAGGINLGCNKTVDQPLPVACR